MSPAPSARAVRAWARISSTTADSRSACSSAALASRLTSGSGDMEISSSRIRSAVSRLRSWWDTSSASVRSRWMTPAIWAAARSSTSQIRSSSSMPGRAGEVR